MTLKNLNSLDLHLMYPTGTVLKTKQLEDTTCGLYPCYYYKDKDSIFVSTSVTSLIQAKEDFKLNNSFTPPNFLYKQSISYKIKKFFNKEEKCYNYYSTWGTIDLDISKLRSMEEVTLNGNYNSLKPRLESIKNPNLFINLVANKIQNFIQEIELVFPEHKHVVLVGGKDSQLILLAPKLKPNNWEVFSADPNYDLVNEWIMKNNLKVNCVHYHNNLNEETKKDLKKKIIASDGLCNPQHIRWLPTLKRIANHQKTIFWCGTAGDALNTNKFKFQDYNKLWYFHSKQVALWQGNYHQTFKNFVNCPLLSPYHSKEIWENIYSKDFLSVFKDKQDLRDDIGDKLRGESIEWSESNPSPRPYEYNFYLNTKKYYLKTSKNLVR